MAVDRAPAGAGGGDTRSPLYTSPAARVAKLEFVQTHGRDTDGAYRTTNRIDKAGVKQT